MALILKDRVQETSTTTGTGTLTLAGAVTQFQTFSSAIGNGNTTYYTIYNAGGSLWEVGIGTVGAGTLSRDTVLSSSNSGSLVSFTGTLYVFCDYPAGKAAYQDASGVINNATFNATTSVITPIVQATNSGGLSLKNSAGTTQISMGGGGGDNVSVNVSTNLNGANAQIDISPTGTGHVHMNPTGSGSVEINPTSVGTINNMTIGATTPKNGSFVDLSVTGTTSFDGSQGSAGQVLTSAGTGNTPTWATPTTGTVTSVAASVPSVLSITGSPITTSGTLAITYSGTALPAANGGTGLTSPGTAGNVLTSTGTGWSSVAASSGSPAGTTGQLQYNNSGSFGGLSSGSNGQTLVSGGSGSNPAFSAGLVVASNNVDTSANTGGFIPPSGTTAQRPSSPVAGTTRFNTTLNTYEVYNGSWQTLAAQIYSASYLIAAGGAGGGGTVGAGGGSGGLLGGSFNLVIGTTYTVTVGAGGGGGVNAANGSNGSNSSISGLTTAVGGGGGANNSGNGTSGGSGGGGANSNGGTAGSGASGTLGQGYAGGNGNNNAFPTGASGGGGGSSAVGGLASGATGGSGGAGTSSSITGSAVSYAGGGGGWGGTTGGTGGSGGGGAGSSGVVSANGTSGTANTGSGGGGAANGGTGGNGGSGIVIISVPTASYSGTTSGSPTVTTSGSNTIMKFTSSGSYTA